MKRFLPSILTFALLSAAAIGASAQTPDNAATADHTTSGYDMKAQSLVDLERVQKKFVDLANAVPTDKLTWRPSEDSRSFAEVFLHVAGERYQILGLGGATPPADFNGKTFEKSTNDKAREFRSEEHTSELQSHDNLVCRLL